MLNKPHHPFQPSLRPDSYSAGSWQTDQNPTLRLGLLFCVISLPLLGVAGRVWWLKTELRDRFVERFEKTYEELEAIPAPDGRILSSEGQVLAYDEEYFTLRVHYRWLEEPADPLWLRGQANARLSEGDRRDREKVSQAETEILQLREQMWQRLAELTNVSPEELQSEREKIQQRVERIVSLVETRRSERDEQTHAQSPPQPLEHWWQRLAWKLRHELTTPPRRGTQEPLIVREELDYHPLLEDIPFESVAEIESRPQQFPGLRVTYGTRRVYPHASVASHVIGHRSESEQQSGEEADSPLSSSTGTPGRHGNRTFLRPHLERPARRAGRLSATGRERFLRRKSLREPQPGQDVVLSIDLALQQHCEQILDRTLASRENPQPEAGGQSRRDRCADRRSGRLRERTASRFEPVYRIRCGSMAGTDERSPAAVLSAGDSDGDRPRLGLQDGHVRLAAAMRTDRPRRTVFLQRFSEHPRAVSLLHLPSLRSGTRRNRAARSDRSVVQRLFLSSRPDDRSRRDDLLGRQAGLRGAPTGIDLPGEASGNLPRPGRLSPGKSRQMASIGNARAGDRSIAVDGHSATDRALDVDSGKQRSRVHSARRGSGSDR